MESLPISALQHLIFCPRQCALIHLEQMWTENQFTAEGRVLHDRAHDGPDESRPGIRTTRGLPVRSESLGIHGVCDVVEFHAPLIHGSKGAPLGRVVPVEYKRGKPKSHQADEVQLCAQALCLEETLDCWIPEGALYYGKPRRRTVIAFDDLLRDLTIDTVSHLHALMDSQVTPSAVYEKSKCSACSLIETCQPRARPSAARWFEAEIANLHSECEST